MIIERNKDEIIFKIAADTNIDELQEFADLLKFKELSRKSKVSQRQANELAKEAKKVDGKRLNRGWVYKDYDR